jgi:hypothetical protein
VSECKHKDEMPNPWGDPCMDCVIEELKEMIINLQEYRDLQNKQIRQLQLEMENVYEKLRMDFNENTSKKTT